MMPILRKILEELDEEVPDTSYVRGMLEALIEMQAPTILPTMNTVGASLIPAPKTFPTAEAGLRAPNNLEEIKRMAQGV